LVCHRQPARPQIMVAMPQRVDFFLQINELPYRYLLYYTGDVG
jgi:hypothetical protein